VRHIYNKSIAELLGKLVNIENYSDFNDSVQNIADKPNVY
jgi:hypothetical protein